MRQPLVLVCISGGIAAYKSCTLVRALQKAGADVKVAMTEHATNFVCPVTFRALTHHEVAVGLFDDPQDPIHHISLAQEPDLIIVAPATANIIAKMAHGIADDLVSTTLLATKKPLLVAPAMNTGMWTASSTQENISTLRDRGVRFVGPDSGYLACGDVSSGRMSEPEEIASVALSLLSFDCDLDGLSFLITAGPTHEAIDPVRFIGNRSSGKMGIELARAAASRGAHVDLVLGPSTETVPSGVAVHRVESAQQMFDQSVNLFEKADCAICAAAVADYTPATVADHKLKKAKEPLSSIELVETKDILQTLSEQKGSRCVVGFAAETDRVLEHAQRKLLRKGCDAIIANDVSRSDSGFGSDTNKASWVTENQIENLPLMTKAELAHAILDRIMRIKNLSQKSSCLN